MSAPQAPCERFVLAPGVVALPRGLLWLERARALVAADTHLAYEDVIGGALPLWSTAEIIASLAAAAATHDARELIFLGDVIHGSRMSEGAARAVEAGLASLRATVDVTLVAGNHEGRTRGERILGATEEAVERDGWLLVHGDEPPLAHRAIVGHLHPSLALGGGASTPAFLASSRLVVVPALTPYSSGLDVLSRACANAISRLGADVDDCSVIALGRDRLHPFGSVAGLRKAIGPRADIAAFGRRRSRKPPG